MSPAVLVLTATGTTGSQTVAALVRRGASVRAATRDPQTAKVAAGAEVVAWSYDEPATWGPALSGIDALYFAIPSFRSDEIEVGNAIIAAAKAAGVRRIVKLSAAGVDAVPLGAHRQLEEAIERSGLSWIHLRPSFFHENFIEFYGGPIQSEGKIYLPAGTGKTGFIAAEDIGEIAATALLSTRSGEAWTLTGPESLDHYEVAAALSSAIGKPVSYVDIPPEAFEQSLRGYGTPEPGVQTMSALYGYVRAGWTGELSPKAQEVLGREPLKLADWAKTRASAWR